MSDIKEALELIKQHCSNSDCSNSNCEIFTWCNRSLDYSPTTWIVELDEKKG